MPCVFSWPYEEVLVASPAQKFHLADVWLPWHSVNKCYLATA